MYSDASATSCGSVIGFNNEYVCHRMWTDIDTENESISKITIASKCAIE